MIGMARYPDKFFDLAIADPPYGIGEDGTRSQSRKSNSKMWPNQKLKHYTGIGWDDSPMTIEYFIELKRISRNQIIWGANHFIENIPNANSSGWIVWYKKGQNPNCDFSDCELAYTSFKRGCRYFKYDWTGFGAVNAKERRIHPTQKPVHLYKWLLTNYAQPGNKILDTHMGSQSSRIAAYQMGFDYWGMEIDREYFESGNKRFNEQTAQLKLL